MPEPAHVGSPGRVRPGKQPLGAGGGGYLVACGWTPPTVPSPHHAAAVATPDTASQFLALISTELRARGLEVRHSRRQGILAEISVSSPAHPDRGSVGIGYDGFMVWERWTPAADSDRATGIVRLIAWILLGDGVTATGSTR